MRAGPVSIDAMPEDAAMQDLLGPIRERNRAKLLTRVIRVREAILGPQARLSMTDELRGDLHALIGALGTYGWATGSAIMSEVQTALNAGKSAAHLAPALDLLIDDIGTPRGGATQ